MYLTKAKLLLGFFVGVGSRSVGFVVAGLDGCGFGFEGSFFFSLFFGFCGGLFGDLFFELGFFGFGGFVVNGVYGLSVEIDTGHTSRFTSTFTHIAKIVTADFAALGNFYL